MPPPDLGDQGARRPPALAGGRGGEVLGDDGGAGALKKLTTEAVNEFFAPIRARRAELAADEGHLLDVLHAGNERANEAADRTLDAVRTAMHMDY